LRKLFVFEFSQKQMPICCNSKNFKKRASTRFAQFLSALTSIGISGILATELPAQAVLTYYVYEPTGSGNVIIETAGSLNLPTPVATGSGGCPTNGGVFTALAIICSGPGSLFDEFSISGPPSFGVLGPLIADSSSGILAGLNGDMQLFGIPSSYSNGTPIISSSTFSMTTLAALGFTTPGLLGTWTLAGTGDTIEVRVAAPPAPPTSATPGPLPILGAAAAFGSVRKLRRYSAALKQG
jgi:hypothetical protein